MKNTAFSRILSIVLALSMVIALVPSAFAAEAGYKIVYDFTDNYADGVSYTSSEVGFFTYKGVNAVDSFDKSNGFWKFEAMNGSLSVNHAYTTANSYQSGLVSYFNASANWYAIKVRVPASGTYSMKLEYRQHSSYESNLGVYTFSSDATSDVINAGIADGTGKVGAVNFTKGSWDAPQTASVGSVTLSAGEHILVFHSPNGKTATIRGIMLTSGDGSLVAPMSASISASKTTLDASVSGDSANVTITSAVYSDTSVKTSGIQTSDFVFTSSNNSLATVDANGKVTVSDIATNGTVKISVAAKANPAVVLGTVSFNIVATDSSNVKLVYDFIDNYAEGVPYTTSENNFFTYKGVNEVDTYDKSNGFWKFAAMESTLSVNHQYNATSAYANGLMAYFGATYSWYAIKIRVPKTDVYSASIGTIATSGHDTNLEVYILDGASDESAIAESVANGTGKIGTVDCTKGGYSALDSERRTLGNVKLSAGEHIVVFHAANGKNAKVWSFVLKGGNGSVTVPMAVNASVSKTTLDASKSGDSAEIALSSVVMSDATLKTSGINMSDFVFESSDNSLATVDANGKITVVSSAPSGDVTVSVASKDNPDFILGTASLEVVAMVSPNVNIVYDFIDNYAEGVPYTTSEIGFFTHKGVNEVASYDKSNGFWKFAALEGLLSVNHQYNASAAYANGLMAYFGATNSWYAIKVRVPKTDIYSASIGTIATSGHETNLELYIIDGASDASTIAESIANGTGKIGTVDCTKGGYSALDSERRTLGSIKLSAGEHIVVFHAANGKNAKVWSFALKGGNGSVTVPMGAKLSAPKTLDRGNGDVVSVEKVFMSDATEVSSLDGITFESSDASVVSVSGSVIRAVSTGDAKIYAKYAGEVLAEASITVTEAALSESVSFVATSNCGVKIDVSGITYNGAVDSVAPGKTITVSAPEVDGYKFRYWKSGNNGGRYLSSEDKYSFKLVTHTYITAVYDKIEDGKATLEFFNGNGAFIEGKSVSLGAKFGDIKIANPSLTGFAFLNWSVDDDALINGDTRAVAIYNEDGKAVSGSVTVDGTAEASVTYDKKITAHKSGATHWLRDGKVVAYGESYTHYVWDATAIVSSDKAIEKMPIVVLEDTTVDGAYMIEYDAAGFEIVEVGIVFGNSDATVGSCTSKATSQRNANHGQFTAIPSGGESGARGYIIYKDGSVNRIVYSK